MIYELGRLKPKEITRNNNQLRGKTPRTGETSTVCCLNNEAKFAMKNGYKNAALQSLSSYFSCVPLLACTRGYLYMLLIRVWYVVP